MRYGKVMAYILTVCFLAAAVGIGLLDDRPVSAEEPLKLSVLVDSGQTTEEITCWQQEEGRYYFFLPSYARLEQTEFRLDNDQCVILDGQKIENGTSCEDLQPDKTYAMEVTKDGRTESATVTFLRSGQTPALYVDVQSRNMDYIHEKKGNKESGRIALYAADGTLDYAGNLKSIGGRGNATWALAKKPYSLVLAEEGNLLGMGAAQRWVLLANGGDPSHIRNKLVYDFAAEAGLSFSPDCTWVDLYLNGEYAGLYLLSERNEIHTQRVALEENSSFLVSMELEMRLVKQEYPFVSMRSGADLRIHHSSIPETELAKMWQSAENAILAEDGVDPDTGKSWQELIDLDSWARKYLVEEIFGSVDAGSVSQYFYADPAEGKIYAGPVWDFDNALGNASEWQLCRPEAFFADRARLNAWADQPWFHALCKKEAFHSRVLELYREEYRPLLKTYLCEKLAAYAQQVEKATALDQLRWQTDPMESEVEYILGYMTRRMEFLDSLWLDGEVYYRVLVDMGTWDNTACYAVREGEPLPKLLDVTDIYGAVGWYHRDTDTPVDLEMTVDRDLDIYLKYENWEDDNGEVASAAESCSLQYLAPALVFGGMLVLMCGVGLWQCRGQRKKEPVHR